MAARITTRSSNAAKRPGLADQAAKRRTSDEVAAERQAKEEAKQEKARAKATSVKRVAEFEKNQAATDALDATPRPAFAPQAQAPPLRRMSTHAFIPLYGELPTSDVEMVEVAVDRGSSYFEGVDGGDTEVEEATPPPKKKKKVVAPEAAKAPKIKLRDAIKAAQVSDEEMAPAGEFTEGNDRNALDLDPTPKKKSKSKSKMPVPAAESDGDQGDGALKPRMSWKMAVLGDGDDMDVERQSEGKVKTKGKGKEKLSVAKEDNKIDRASASNSKSNGKGSENLQRVVPKSNSYVSF